MFFIANGGNNLGNRSKNGIWFIDLDEVATTDDDATDARPRKASKTIVTLLPYCPELFLLDRNEARHRNGMMVSGQDDEWKVIQWTKWSWKRAVIRGQAFRVGTEAVLEL